jgi:MscS family membrane protein
MKRLGPALIAAGLAGLALGAPPDWAQAVTERLPGSFLGLHAWQWIGVVALTVIGLFVHEIARYVARKLMLLRERGTGAKSVAGERSVRRGAGILGFTVPWFIFMDQLELGVDGASKFRLGIQALAVLGTVSIVYGIWDAICDALAHRAGSVVNAERLLIPVTRKLVRFVIVVAGMLAGLGVFGVNISGLLAGVGIGGLVVALAAKDSVENVFGSLTILFDMPFALGDWVKIDKVEGIVEEINLRSTKVRTFEDSLITLPNSNLIKAAVENYGARRYRRQRFQIRVSYWNTSENLERFMDAIRTYLASAKGFVHARNLVEVNDMTEVSVGILVQCFIEADSFHEEAKIRGDLMLEIFRAREESGVIFVGTPMADAPAEPELTEADEKQIADKEDII